MNFSSYIDTLYTDPNAPNSRLSNYEFDNIYFPDPRGGRVYNSLASQAIPFYAPPRRLWGFDVGLLVQTPDRFAERFSKDLPTFNDFFREVEKSDPWVQALLCAAQPENPNAINANGEINQGQPYRVGTLPERYTVRALFGLRDLPDNPGTPVVADICDQNRHIINSYN